MTARQRAALEAHLSGRRFRITSADGRPLGTGFAVGGHILTCAHVAGGIAQEDIRIEIEGESAPVRSRLISWRHDAALLTVERSLGSLAVAAERPATLLISGFPAEAGLARELMIDTPVGASASIDYMAGGRSFSLENVWTFPGGVVTPGFSGAPAVDAESGAVAGMIVADFIAPPGKTGLAGFILPLARLLEDDEFGTLLARKMESAPRFGAAPNEAGALAWCKAATRNELERLADEQRFDTEGLITRTAAEEEFARFLGGPARIWAIVDRSGVGKSTTLAHLTKKATDRPALFLRALDVASPATSLSELVRQKLAASAPDYVAGGASLERLIEASRPPLLLTLDGINETALSVADLRDRWLPEALRQAAGAKLVLSCRPESWGEISARIPEHWLHRTAADEGADGPPRPGKSTFELGDFSSDERREYILSRFGAVPPALRGVGNPFLLAIAAEISEELPDFPVSRWSLLSRWVTSHCQHAAESAPSHAVENLLERVAFECLRLEQRALPRLDPLVRDPAFAALLRENLLVREAGSYGFRYDPLFEHLAARSFEADGLDYARGSWRHGELRIEWPVIVAFCERLAETGDGKSIALMWDKLHYAPGMDAQSLIRAMVALPVSADHYGKVLDMLAAIGREEAFTLSFSGREIAASSWPPKLKIGVLKLLVRAASGYDYRANDLAETMRFTRNIHQFEFEGFRHIVTSLLDGDREAFLSALAVWHGDKTRLGEFRKAIRESSVSSWTSCCLVFCADLFTDAELLSVIDPEESVTVFGGLAFVDYDRLGRLPALLAAKHPFDKDRFRAALRALAWAGRELPAKPPQPYFERALALALDRFDAFDNYEFQSDILTWSAAVPELRSRAWELLVAQTEKGEADSHSFRYFLPYRPDEVVALVERHKDKIHARKGSPMLDLAESPLRPREPASDELVGLRARLIRDEIAARGYDAEICDVIEGLFYELEPRQLVESGIARLAAEAVASGAGARVLIYFAGDRNAQHRDGLLALSDGLAEAFAETSPVAELVAGMLGLRFSRCLNSGQFERDLSLLRALRDRAAARFGPDVLAEAFRIAPTFALLGRDSGRIEALAALAEGDRSDPRLAEIGDLIRAEAQRRSSS